jgi:hypothetical protein
MKPGASHPTSLLFEHYVVRAIVALCSIAAHTTLDDVRDDMRDASAILIRLTTAALSDESGDSMEEIRIWCDRMAVTLDTLIIDDGLLHIRPSARLAIIRLRSLLPQQTESTPRAIPEIPVAPQVRKTKTLPQASSVDLNRNQKKIFDFVSQHPNVRTRELVGSLSPALSDRTIKRCLKELVGLGILERVQIQGAVSYCVPSHENA